MRGDPYYVGPFTGGLNLRDSPMELPTTHSPELLNVMGGQEGIIRKRDPCLQINSNFPGGGTFDMKSLYYSKALDDFIGVTSQVKGWRSPLSGGASTDITGTIGGSGSAFWNFVDAPVDGAFGPVYGVCGGLVPQSYNGTTAFVNIGAITGTIPNADQAIYFKNRLWMVGGSLGNGVAASAVGQPAHWDFTAVGSSNAWTVQLDPSDGTFAMGLGVVGSYVIVFKETKCYIIYDADTGANRILSSDLGCEKPRSIVSTPYGLVWLAQDGHVYVTDGVKVTKLSDIVTYPFSSAAALVYDGFGYPVRVTIEDCPGIYADNKYYISVHYLSGPRITWVYDFETKSWWKHSIGFWDFANFDVVGNTSYPMQAAGAWKTPTNNGTFILALFSTGQNMTTGIWQDNFLNYNAFYKTPPLAPVSGKKVNFHQRRRFHAMRAYISGQVDIQTSSDVTAVQTPTFTTQLSLTNRLLDYPSMATIYSLGVANDIQFKFTSTDAFAWELHPFYLYSQPRAD